MKRFLIGLSCILAILIIRPWLFPDQESSVKTSAEALPPSPTKPPIGNLQLSDYRIRTSSAEEDMHLLTGFIDTVFIMVKNRDPRHYSTNEELALFLKGQNPYRETFLSSSSPLFNKEGLLIDRWERPLIIHPVSAKKLEIRCAGPDKKPYTEDDLLHVCHH